MSTKSELPGSHRWEASLVEEQDDRQVEKHHENTFLVTEVNNSLANFLAFEVTV